LPELLQGMKKNEEAPKKNTVPADAKILERIKTSLISFLGYWAIRIVCRSLRWEIEDWENLESIHKSGKRFVAAFWHNRMFMAAYHFRKRGIVVMISQNRDGEYIARVIQRLGYRVARGSSTRGSRGAIVQILNALKKNRDVAFTPDGPQGPRYMAKPGAAYVAWKSGHPIMPFNIAVEKKWVLRSWDHFIIPKPFSKALLQIGPPIYVDPLADEEGIQRAESMVQTSLDALRERGDTRWGGPADR
jgi:lysophospholipid acyltransferase (LPLAT)-like uncharacterized protein